MKAVFVALADFVHLYAPLHLPLVACICCFGSVSHVLIIVVLSRKQVFNANNLLMISLSVCQLTLLQSYLFFSLNSLLAEHQCQAALWTYGWVMGLLVSINLNVVVHSIAVYHVVVMSVVRLLTIALYSQRVRKGWLTLTRAVQLLALIYLSVPVICVPVFLSSTVTPNANRTWCPDEQQRNLSFTPYRISMSKLADRQSFYKFNFWWYGLLCKLFPCLFLIVMSVLLSLKLRQLSIRSSLVKSNKSRKRKYNRTTYMTLAVMALFVVIELPQSLLNLAAGIGGDEYLRYYSQINDFFEMLTVLYSSVNFLIFCLMSEQFRRTFMQLFNARCGTYKELVSQRSARMASSIRRASHSVSLFVSEAHMLVPSSRTSLSRSSEGGAEGFPMLPTGYRRNTVHSPVVQKLPTTEEEDSQQLFV